MKRQPHRELQVTFSRQPPVYYPGEMIHAQVAVESTRALAVRELSASLVCQEAYEYFDRNLRRKGWLRDETATARQVLVAEAALPAGERQVFDLIAPLPPAAPPTWAEGQITSFKWFVRARMERKLAADRVVEQPLVVQALAAPEVLPLPPAGLPDELAEIWQGEVRFDLPLQSWQPGGDLAGRLIVSPHEALKARGLRIELVRHEYVPFLLPGENVLQALLARRSQIRAGSSWQVPFHLPAPTLTPTGLFPPEVFVWQLRATAELPFHSGPAVTVNLGPARQGQALTLTGYEVPRADGLYGRGLVELPGCQVGCSFDQTHWLPGQPLTGSLHLRAQKDLSVREIHLELVPFEDHNALIVPADHNHCWKVEGRSRLSGPVVFPRGQSAEFPFCLPIPHPRPGTGRLAHSRVRWYLKAIVDLPLKQDLTFLHEVIVT